MSKEQFNETAVTDAQLSKLKLEIEDLERKKTWQYKLIQFLPLITAMVAVGGLVKQEELRTLIYFLIPTVSGGGILLGNEIYIIGWLSSL